jgi:hypothetical protein
VKAMPRSKATDQMNKTIPTPGDFMISQVVIGGCSEEALRIFSGSKVYDGQRCNPSVNMLCTITYLFNKE